MRSRLIAPSCRHLLAAAGSVRCAGPAISLGPRGSLGAPALSPQQHLAPLIVNASNCRSRERRHFWSPARDGSTAAGGDSAAADWTGAMKLAESALGDKSRHTTGTLLGVGLHRVLDELPSAARNLLRLAGSDHPLSRAMRSYLFEDVRHVRSMIVLLMSRALGRHGERASTPDGDQSIRQGDGITDENVAEAEAQRSRAREDLATITQLIYQATRVHETVIEMTSVPRADRSDGAMFGNKMAVLTGDFLLAKSCVALAGLKSARVVELMSTAIGETMEGCLQDAHTMPKQSPSPASSLASASNSSSAADPAGKTVEECRRSVIKAGSLLSRACEAAAVLEKSEDLAESARNYGRAMGAALEIAEDVSYWGSHSKRADPPTRVLALPVAYAMESVGWLKDAVARGFSGDGDIAAAREYVASSGALDRSRAVCKEYGRLAIDALSHVPSSAEKDAMMRLAACVHAID